MNGKNIPKKVKKPTTKNWQQTSKSLELSELIIQIEKSLRFSPVDIEWARENNRFYITQSRPDNDVGREKLKIENITEFEKKFIPEIQHLSFSKVGTMFRPLMLSREKMGDQKSLTSHTVIHYMNDGVIEVWGECFLDKNGF